MTDTAPFDAIAHERRRCDAFVAGDLDAIAALLDDDLRYTHSNGTVDTKTTLLAMLGSKAVRYALIAPDVRHMAQLGSEGVVLTGILETHALVGDEKKELRGCYTAVWRPGSDAVWRLVALQGSNVVGPVP